VTLIVVNQAEEHFLDLILGVNYTLRLFKNDAAGSLTQAQLDALTEASFTEADFAGYAGIALTGGSWTTTTGDPCTGTYAAQTFTRSSTGTAQTLYGYYVTRTTGGALEWFEEFTVPLVIEFINEAVTITPRLTLSDTGD
jgi:hypothetical protein